MAILTFVIFALFYFVVASIPLIIYLAQDLPWKCPKEKDENKCTESNKFLFGIGILIIAFYFVMLYAYYSSAKSKGDI